MYEPPAAEPPQRRFSRSTVYLRIVAPLNITIIVYTYIIVIKKTYPGRSYRTSRIRVYNILIMRHKS